MQDLYREIEIKMKQAVDHLHEELKKLRTGRANPVVLDGVMVDYYGTPTPLRQLASITVADASLLVAQPFDTSQITAMERAIHAAGLGLNPSNDGKIIRIPIPALTEERRKELVKKANDIAEASRNSVRQARREGNDQLKKMQKDKKISEDDEHRGHDEMQKLHDHYIGQVNETLERKEKDIMTV
ncbi:MAG TPA: ribosome recycling factor [Thermoanaerobaculia bacterium]|jgi:ribosome recycling factor